MQFDELCIAPCEVDIAPAHYRFGVAPSGRRARPVSDILDVSHDLTLRVIYEDRGDLRLTGGLLLTLGILGGLTSIAGLFVGFAESSDPDSSRSALPISLVGGSIGVVFLPVGLGLALLKDVAEVRIDPNGAIRF